MGWLGVRLRKGPSSFPGYALVYGVLFGRLQKCKATAEWGRALSLAVGL